MASFTASATERAFRCAASCALAKVHTPQSKDAARGHGLHEYSRGVISGESVIIAPEYAAEAQSIDFSAFQAWDAKSVTCELAMAYDVASDTARKIGINVGRNYGELAAAEVAGSADIALDMGDGTGHVIDLKFGAWDVAPPSENLQLRTLAVALARLYDLTSVKVSIYHWRNGEWTFTDHVLSAMDLDLHAQAMRDAWDAINRPSPTVNPGEHCHFCNCVTNCPAHFAALVKVARESMSIEHKIEALDAAALPEAYQQLIQLERLTERCRTAIEARAKVAPIDLGGGKVLQMAGGKRTSIVTPVALRVLREEVGAEAADAACGVSASSIEKACGDKKKAARVLESIGAKGGMIVNETKPSLKVVAK